MLVLTSILATCNIAVAIGTWRAANATLKYANTTDDTAHKQLRAYLFISRDRPDIKADKTGEVTADVIVKNKGQTPAYKVQQHSRHVVNDKNGMPPEPSEFFADKSPLGELSTISMIGPNDEVTIPIHFVIGLDDVLRIKNGERVLWCLIYFEYTDIYGVKQLISCHCFVEFANGKLEFGIDNTDGT